MPNRLILITVILCLWQSNVLLAQVTFLGVPSDTTVACGMVPLPALVTAIDTASQVVTVEFFEERMGACPDTLLRTWSALDVTGTPFSVSQLIQIEDLIAPVISGIPADTTLSCLEIIPDPVSGIVTDNCDLSPSLSFLEEDLGDILIRTWISLDLCGNSDTARQTVSILNTAPTFLGVPSDTLLNCTESLGLPIVSAIDLAGNPVSVTLSVSNVFVACDKITTKTWTATDSCGNISIASQVIIFQDIDPPVLSAMPLDTLLTCVDEVPTPPIITAIDDCQDTINIIYSEIITSTGYERTWTASDSCGNAISHTQVITVTLISAPTILGVPMDTTIFCPFTSAGPIGGINAQDGAGSALVPVFNQSNNIPDCPRIINKTWTVTDLCGVTVVDTLTITIIDDESPVLIVPSDTVIGCTDTLVIPEIYVNDDCDNDIELIFSADTTGVVITQTWVATDQCGNSSTASRTVVRSACNPPILYNENVQTCFNEPLLINVLENDETTDFPIDTTSLIIITAPLNGTILILSGGELLYTPAITFSGIDVFEYQVIDTAGNSSNIGTTTVDVNTEISQSSMVIDADCASSVGFVFLGVLGGDFPYSYLWSDSTTGKNLLGVIPGSYFVTVTDSRGCVDTATHVINSVGPIITNVTPVKTTGCNTLDGQVLVDIDTTSSTGPYSVILNSSFISSGLNTLPLTVNNIPPGTLISDIVVIDANGCIASVSGAFKIKRPRFDIISVTPLQPDCATLTGGVEIEIFEPGILPIYTKLDGLISGPYNTNPFFIELPEGEYSNLGVRDFSACKDFISIALELDEPDGCSECPIPDNLLKTVFSESLVLLNWDTIAGGSGEYALEYREVGALSWNFLILDTNVILLDSLSECTSHEWRLRGLCGIDTSDYSSIKFFSTLCISPRFSSEGKMHSRIYPNPAGADVNLSLKLRTPGDVKVLVTDLLGRVCFQKEFLDQIEVNFELDLNKIDPGLYLVTWIHNEAQITDRLIVNK